MSQLLIKKWRQNTYSNVLAKIRLMGKTGQDGPFGDVQTLTFVPSLEMANISQLANFPSLILLFYSYSF